ncbi:MAG: DUF4248 domain-containing protein [Bacteroidetes bacterium]|nr:DUF4248 domain-containing protein [Bacteroidota bacterium]
MKQSENKSIEIKPYMLNELARFYQISDPTLRAWIKGFEEKLGKRVGRYYSAKQVEIIFEELGLPKTISY